MPKGHLVPTPITNVNGVATTVYRRPVTGASVPLSLPPVAPALVETASSSVEEILGLFDYVDERLEHSLREATPEQLRDVEDAMVVARERESRILSKKYSSGSLRGLVADGAYSAVAKIAEKGDSIPNSTSLRKFGVHEVARDMAAMVESIIPLGMNISRSVESYTKIPAVYLDPFRRAVEAAAYLDGNVAAENRVESNMYSLINMHTIGEYEYIADFDRYWKDMPDGMKVGGFRSVMAALDKSNPPEGGRFTHIASHLKACYEHSRRDKTQQALIGQVYLHNYRLANGIEMYPDNVDEVLQWDREGRGAGYDSDAFRDYLKGGIMREGML